MHDIAANRTEPSDQSDQTGHADTRDNSARQLWAVVVIALVAVAVRVYLAVTTKSTAEDFYITLRYAENLAGGHGLVFNPGERVLGTTTPFYAMFIALAEWLGLDASWVGKLTNIAADGVSCWLIWRLARNAGAPAAGLIAAALFALSPPNLTWAISGMETSLVTACTLGLFASTSARKHAAVAVLGAVLYVLRIDGLLAVAFAFGALLWSTRRHGDSRRLSRGLALFAALCAPWTLFAWAYYGSPLPTSALAKLTVYAWMSKGAFPNLGPFTHQMTHSALHLVLLAGAGVGLAVGFARKELRPALLWMLVYYAAMAFSKGFLFGWYYVPPSGVYYLAAVLGWVRLLGLIGPIGQIGRIGAIGNVGVVVAAAALVLGLVRLPGVRAQIAADQQKEERFRKPIGLALREIVRPGERLMLEPIGYIGYFSRARVLDAVGLISPEVIPYYRKGAVSPYLNVMHDLQPEWVLLRAGEYEDAKRAAVPSERALDAHYHLYREFPDPDAPPGSPPGFYLFRRQ